MKTTMLSIGIINDVEIKTTLTSVINPETVAKSDEWKTGIYRLAHTYTHVRTHACNFLSVLYHLGNDISTGKNV